MAEVNVTIGGQSFGIACDAGQEQRVQHLGRYVDQRLGELSQGSGANNKAQLMVLTTLLLADEIFDLKDHLHHVANTNTQPREIVKEVVKEVVKAPPVYQGLAPTEEKEITEAISKLAAKVEKLSKKVAKS